jgi:hypothetical protein
VPACVARSSLLDLHQTEIGDFDLQF